MTRDCYQEKEILDFNFFQFPSHSEKVEGLFKLCVEAVDESDEIRLFKAGQLISKSVYQSKYLILAAPYYTLRQINPQDWSYFKLAMLPNFDYPARTFDFQVVDDIAIPIVLITQNCKELSKIDPSQFIRHFPLHKDDEVGFRRAVIEIVKHRTAECPNEDPYFWLEKEFM